MSADGNPFSEERNPCPESGGRIRDTYGLPMFLGAWIGACAQGVGGEFPDYGWIAFLTAVVLIAWFARQFNRR